jgi:hypothetical protein
MRILQAFPPICIGLGLVVGLLLAMGLQSSLAEESYLTSVATNASIHYVAPSGEDQGECLAPVAPCRTPQYAVDKAMANDEIRLAQGVYSDLNTRGGYAQVVYITKTITLRGGYTLTNWTTPDFINHPAIFDAHHQGRALFITGPITATLEGLRITHGNANGAPANTDGGGISILGASAIISACQIISNTAQYNGGGIFQNGDDFHLINSQIISNTSGDSGGGVFNGPPYGHYDQDISTIAAPGTSQIDSNGNTSLILNNLFISNLTVIRGGGMFLRQGNALFINNSFGENTGSVGGGLFIDASNALVRSNIFKNNANGGGIFSNYSTLVLEDNTIHGNTAGQGGGLYLFYSVANLLRNEFTANTASSMGGGIYSLDTPTTLDRNLIAGNATTQFWGGGMVMDGSNFTMTNNLIVENYSADYGSGLLIDRVSAGRMLHNTIARNKGIIGDGLMIASNSHISLTNTILVSQTNGILLLGRESSARLEGTFWGSGAWANGTDWYSLGTLVTGTVNIWANPRFIDPTSGNYHLSSDSAAIDSGVNTGILWDIDGDPRPSLLAYDIGADELTTGYLIYLPLIRREISFSEY